MVYVLIARNSAVVFHVQIVPTWSNKCHYVVRITLAVRAGGVVEREEVPPTPSMAVSDVEAVPTLKRPEKIFRLAKRTRRTNAHHRGGND